jgi:hypothetical protein
MQQVKRAKAIRTLYLPHGNIEEAKPSQLSRLFRMPRQKAETMEDPNRNQGPCEHSTEDGGSRTISKTLRQFPERKMSYLGLCQLSRNF